MIQEIRTSLPPADVIAAAKEFFTKRSAIYSAFLEKEGPGFVTFRGQGGEELVIGATAMDGATTVRGSTYLFDQQMGRFFTSLEPVPFSEAVTE
jgi:hypothetical protein